MSCTLIHGDCLVEMDKLIRGGQKVDLVLTDVPYGTVKGLTLDGWENQSTEWDNTIPTEPMFNCIERLLRMNGVCILFSQEPYTSYLRQFKPQNLPFIYPLYWVKDHFANPFTSGKAPVSYVEDLTVYRKKHDSDNQHPLRSYAQTDPLVAYTREGFNLFDEMLSVINKETTLYLLKAEIKQNLERKQVEKPTGDNSSDKTSTKTPRKVQKVGRNDPCWCGSGKKFKNCHGKQ